MQDARNAARSFKGLFKGFETLSKDIFKRPARGLESVLKGNLQTIKAFRRPCTGLLEGSYRPSEAFGHLFNDHSFTFLALKTLEGPCIGL